MMHGHTNIKPVSYVICFEMTFIFKNMDFVFGLVMVEWCFVSRRSDCQVNDGIVTYGFFFISSGRYIDCLSLTCATNKGKI